MNERTNEYMNERAKKLICLHDSTMKSFPFTSHFFGIQFRIFVQRKRSIDTILTSVYYGPVRIWDDNKIFFYPLHLLLDDDYNSTNVK